MKSKGLKILPCGGICTYSDTIWPNNVCYCPSFFLKIEQCKYIYYKRILEKHHLHSLHPFRSLIVLLQKKAASSSSDGDEGGFEDGKSYLCPQHSHNVCLIGTVNYGRLSLPLTRSVEVCNVYIKKPSGTRIIAHQRVQEEHRPSSLQ